MLLESMYIFSDTELRDGFAVRYLPGKGRHLIATRSFAPGAIILQQDPYVSVLIDERTPDHCDFCFRPCERPLRCSRSKLARYCCKEHQRLAWSAGYKTECEALVRCSPRVPPPTVRLAARLLWRRAKSLQQQTPPPGPAAASPPVHFHHQPPLDSDHEGLWWLQHHWPQLDDRRKQLYAQMAVVTWQYMYGAPDGPSPADDGDGLAASPADAGGDEGGAAGANSGGLELLQPGGAAARASWPGFRAVAQLLSLLSCNCHSVCDEELRPLGVALYPTGALVNHSCSPGALQTFRGGTLLLRALRALEPGEEITISYIELAATRQERRETLLESYFFDINRATQLASEMALPPPLQQQRMLQLSEAVSHAAGGAATAASCQQMEMDSGAGPPRGSADGPGAADGRLAAVPTAEESSAGGSAACGASGGAAGGLRSGSASAGAVRPRPRIAVEVAPLAQLYIFDARDTDQPPWPTDPRDAELTRVDVLCGAEVHLAEPPRPLYGSVSSGGDDDISMTGGGVAGSRRCGLPLPGGLLVRLVPVRPNEPEEEEQEQEGGLEQEEEEEERERGEAEQGQAEGAGAEGRVEGSTGRGTELRGAQLRGGGGAATSENFAQPQPQPGPADVAVSGGGDTAGGGTSGVARVPPPRLRLPCAPASAAAPPRPGRIELLAWGPWTEGLARAAQSRSTARNEGWSRTEAAAGSAAASGPGEGFVAERNGGVADGNGGGAALRTAGPCGGWAEARDAPPPVGPAAAAAVSPSAVSGLLRCCVAALQLSQRAEAALSDGDAAEAVSALQRAVQLLDQHGPGQLVAQRPQAQPQQQRNLVRDAGEDAASHFGSLTDASAGSAEGVFLSLGPHNILRLRLRSQLLKAAIDWGSGRGIGGGSSDIMDLDSSTGTRGSTTALDPWRCALQAARALTCQYELCYPCPAWPNLSLHAATLAKLEMLVGRPRRALQAASRALEGLRKTHVGGDGGPGGGCGTVLAQVVQTAREAEMELQARAPSGVRDADDDDGEDL